MKNYLDAIAVRIAAIETARPVAMGARRLDDRHAAALQELVPGIDLGDVAQQEPDMIQALFGFPGVRGGGAMQGKVVAAAGEVNVVRVRPPFDAHAEQIGVKSLAGLEVTDLERNVAQAQAWIGSFHVPEYLPPRRNRAKSACFCIPLSSFAPSRQKQLYHCYATSTISKSWVMTAVLANMIEAEQYFSADS